MLPKSKNMLLESENMFPDSENMFPESENMFPDHLLYTVFYADSHGDIHFSNLWFI